jgi:hypothetical protein
MTRIRPTNAYPSTHQDNYLAAMGFDKIVKNNAYFSRYQVKYRRRR